MYVIELPTKGFQALETSEVANPITHFLSNFVQTRKAWLKQKAKSRLSILVFF